MTLFRVRETVSTLLIMLKARLNLTLDGNTTRGLDQRFIDLLNHAQLYLTSLYDWLITEGPIEIKCKEGESTLRFPDNLDLLNTKRLYIKKDSGISELDFTADNTYYKYYSAGTTSTPIRWGLLNSFLFSIYPAPDKEYTLIFEGKLRPSKLVAYEDYCSIDPQLLILYTCVLYLEAIESGDSLKYRSTLRAYNNYFNVLRKKLCDNKIANKFNKVNDYMGLYDADYYSNEYYAYSVNDISTY